MTLRCFASICFASICFAQVPQCFNYPANGYATVTPTYNFYGAKCVIGSTTNSLPWQVTTAGVAGCPTTFNYSNYSWNFSKTQTTDSRSGSSGAGCYLGIGGPGFFNSSSLNCSSSGTVCQQWNIILLGNWLGVGYLPGAQYIFGTTSCKPSSNSVTVCSCIPGLPPQCPGREVPVWDSATCSWQCQNVSPIIIDIDGSGYSLTSAANGVWFDFFGTGQIKLSWTAGKSAAKKFVNPFLALDRNHNGRIDSAKELFGNVTQQAPCAPDVCNGFLALAVYDQPIYGGKRDGFITEADAIWKELLLWFDENHDGISQPNEIVRLVDWNRDHPDLAITGFDLNFQRTKIVGQNDNEPRFCAPILGPGAGRITCDWFLVPDNTSSAPSAGQCSPPTH